MLKALVRSTGLLLLVLLVLASSHVALAATVVNGGFETGNLTGWTTSNQDCSDEGGISHAAFSRPASQGAQRTLPADGLPPNWYAYSGTTSPVLGLAIAPPPQGMFAATSDSDGPSSTIMYQDLTLEPSSKHTLSFLLYYANDDDGFFTPATLDCTVVPNEQYRVDLITTTAPLTSVAPGDVLQNLYQTQPGDPLTKAPTALSFDLSAYAGQTVRLRFASVESTGPFLASVDNVQLISSALAQPSGSFVLLPTGPLGTVQISGCGSVTVSTSSPATAGTTLSTAGVIPAGEGPGTSLYLTVVPCAGSKFTGWGGGPCAGTSTNPCQLTIITGTLPVITATFSP